MSSPESTTPFEAMRFEAEVDYLRAKRSLDEANDGLRFAPVLTRQRMCLTNAGRLGLLLLSLRCCSLRRSAGTPMAAEVEYFEGKCVLDKSYRILRYDALELARLGVLQLAARKDPAGKHTLHST